MKHSDISSRFSARGPEIAAMVLAVWVITATVVPNIILSFTETMGFWARVANVLLPLGVYWLLMSITCNVGKAAVLMLGFMIFAAFQLVLLYLYGRSVIAVDMFLNVVTTNPGEVGELLGNLRTVIIAVIFLYFPPLCEGASMWYHKWRLPERFVARSRKWAYGICLAGVLSLALGYTWQGYSVFKHLFPVNALYNLYSAVERTVRTNNYHATSADFSFDAIDTLPDSIAKTYVLVIGETSRADNWQLYGYKRPTASGLVNRSGLTACCRVITQSNTTHKSVPMLLSHLDATNFGDSIYCVKSIISAFREAGYATWFLSNHLRNHSFIDFFGMEADTCKFIRDDFPETTFDSELLPYLHRALVSCDKKKMIVLHTYGSHFNYVDRYPESFRRFSPDTPTDARPEHRSSLINAYDNTILATAAFLDSVIVAVDSAGGFGAMLYTSDHGEDIFDDSRNLFLHASPCPSYYQIHVPMILWMSPAYRAFRPEASANADANSRKFISSSISYFHTAIDLAGLSTPAFAPQYSIINAAYAPPAKLYLNDHNEAVPLSDCGLAEHDFIKLDSLGLGK